MKRFVPVGLLAIIAIAMQVYGSQYTYIVGVTVSIWISYIMRKQIGATFVDGSTRGFIHFGVAFSVALAIALIGNIIRMFLFH